MRLTPRSNSGRLTLTGSTPLVDEAGDGLRKLQHCPVNGKFFQLVAMLPSQVFRPSLCMCKSRRQRGVKETGAGVAATELLVSKIHQEEGRELHPR